MKNIWIIASIVFVIAVAGCASQTTGVLSGVEKGVSLSPKSYSQNDFIEFFGKAKQAGPIITWVGDWQQLADNRSAPHVLQQLSGQFGYKPIIIVQFFQQSTGNLLRPLDDATKQDYRESAVSFARKYKPEYMGLGVEINILYEKSPNDFNDYVDFHNSLYDDIKSASPNTKVFTVFQLERMKGLKGGLFGGANDAGDWQLISITNADMIVFTTYPGIIYNSPSEIPPGYYDQIRAHTSKPVAFSETGWFREGPQGWDSSVQEQVDYISSLFNLTRNISPEFIVWSFLYDQQLEAPFNTMGLLPKDGSTTTAWEVWKSAK